MIIQVRSVKIYNYAYTLNVCTNMQNNCTCAIVCKKRRKLLLKMSSSDEMKLKPTHYTKMHYVGGKSLNIERSKKYIVDTWFDSIMQWCWLCHQAPSGDWPFFYADAQCWNLSRQLSSCPSRPPSASCWPVSEG